MLQLGIRLHDVGNMPLEQLLARVRAQGFTCCHIALGKSLPDVPCTPAALTPGYAHYLKNTFARAGVDIAVLGNYLNLLHPDEDYLDWATQMYMAHIRFAALSVGLHRELQIAEQGALGFLKRVHIIGGSVQGTKQGAEERYFGQLVWG